MADTKQKTSGPEAVETVLVAYVTVDMESGERFDLAPFEDAQDVKAKVSGLIEDWSKSGFLVRGSVLYPWHRVKVIKVNRVDEVLKSEAERRLEEWNAAAPAEFHQGFWKTKQANEKDEKKEEGEKKG